MKAGECSNREELRKRNNKELLDKAHTKKAMKLLANTVEEWEECDPTTSFGGAYNKQLELEEVRVQTERSREQRENTQHLMTMLKELIASATTPQEKSAYQAELVDLMRQAVAQAKLKDPVFSSTSADSMSSTSSPSAPSTSSGT
jgi:folylpolyglutamate synthase/dihydropteroate synthase